MDYPVTEQLTRTLALDRLKELSDAIVWAKAHNPPAVYGLEAERKKLRDEYMKVVK